MSEINLRIRQAGASAGLSVLFLVVYSVCNWVTSLRSGVGSFYFAWERGIPFIPALILPYMSIDLFFVGAPFLARTDVELGVLARRIGFVIVVAGVCFLLWPLRFDFVRPRVEGVMGGIFNWFRGVDLPFNEFPSLHVALWGILLEVYWRHTKAGLLQWGMAAWFVLILLSTVFTYQHHVMDVVGGLGLTVLCFYFFREVPLRGAVTRNLRVGVYYGVGAGVLVGLGFWIGAWGYGLFYFAFGLAMVASGYLFLGAGIFRKERGRIPLVAWVLLWPVLVGQWVSLVYYARRCSAYDRVTEELWIGRRLSGEEGRRLVTAGVVAVVDLTGEFSEVGSLRGVAYLNVAVLDLTGPTVEQVGEAVGFLREQAAKGVVYVHCKVGYSRTAVIAGAYLVATGRARDAEEAIGILREARRGIVVRGEAREALERFCALMTTTTTTTT